MRSLLFQSDKRQGRNQSRGSDPKLVRSGVDAVIDIGVGIAGYGYAGRYWHAPLIRNTPGLSIRAIFSRSEERRTQAAKELGVPTYKSYETLITDPSVELVVIATPHDTHAPLCIAATEAGKHVIVEKMMCLSVAEGKAMIASADRAGVTFSVFQCRRWDSDFLTVQSVLGDELLGEIHTVESCIVSSSFSVEHHSWRRQAANGGGPLRDWGAHLLDQAVVLYGGWPEAVFGDCQYHQPKWDVETAAQVWLRYRNGVRFSIEVGGIEAIPKPRWLIHGSRGALIQYGRDPQQAALRRGVVGPRPLKPENAPRLFLQHQATHREVFPTVIPGNYLAYYANIRETLRGREPLAVQPDDVLSSIRLIEAASEAARLCTVVKLPER